MVGLACQTTMLVTWCYSQWLDWFAWVTCWSPGVTVNGWTGLPDYHAGHRCYSQWLDWLARVPCWVPGVTLSMVGLACQTTMLITWCMLSVFGLASQTTMLDAQSMVGLACQTTMLVPRCYTVSVLDWLARLPCWSPGITLLVLGLACQTTLLGAWCYSVNG